jgi:hypothetical protein
MTAEDMQAAWAQPGQAPRWVRVVLAATIPFLAFVLAVVTAGAVRYGTALALATWLVMLSLSGLALRATRPRDDLLLATALAFTPAVVVSLAAPRLMAELVWANRYEIAVVLMAGGALLILISRPSWRRRWHQCCRVRFGPRTLMRLLALGAMPGIALGIMLTSGEAPRRFSVLEAALSPVHGTPEAGRALERLVDAREDVGGGNVSELAAEKAPLSPQWMENAHRALETYGDALSAARIVAADSRIAVPARTEFAAGDESPAADIRWAADLLRVQARLSLAEGRPGPALQSALQAQRLGMAAAKAGQDSVLYIVGTSVMGEALAVIRQVAASGAATSGLLRPAAGGLDLTADLDTAAVRALASEFNDLGLMQEQVASLEGMEDDLDPQTYRVMRLFLRRAPLLKPNATLNAFGACLEDAAESIGTYRPRAIARYAYGRGRAAGGTGVAGHSFNPLGDVTVKMMAFSVDRLLVDHYLLLATARMTQLFIALRCYQLEHGKLPDSLDDLAPEYLPAVPTDPFTGRPFGYEPTGERPRIWSVGPDQKTDPAVTETGDDVVVPLTLSTKEAEKTDGERSGQ